MIGVSSYFKDYNEEYLLKCRELGAEYVFTSLQIPEDNGETVREDAERLLTYCQSIGLKVIVDVSPETLRIMNVKSYHELKSKGVDVIRLDYGFDDYDEVKLLQETFEIILNASTLNREDIKKMKEHKIDTSLLTAMHNFYPQSLTAMSFDQFVKTNSFLKNEGLRTMAFVSGDEVARYPLYEGLPTVEELRGFNSYVAGAILKEFGQLDDILIGDSFAELSSLEMLSSLEKGVFTLPVILNQNLELKDDLLNVRRDSGKSFVRLTTPRVTGIPLKHSIKRTRGSIVMLNENYGRYCGEVQINKIELPVDARANVIGYVHPEYLDIIECMNDKYKIKLEVINHG